MVYTIEFSDTDRGLKMKSEYQQETVHKEVVIIGNGPSGIALSYMLSGNLPYLTSTSHPDEMLATRLSTVGADGCLIDADLEFLASGLEGRSTNPVSLLLDALSHPCADVGMEEEPLVEFRKNGKEIDHVVLGKGLPGGSWHNMDPQILTLSLGSWMSLPGLPFNSKSSGEKRVYASSVAKYYVQYVEQMNLGKYFRNGVIVTNVQPMAEIYANGFLEHAKEDMNWVRKIEENDSINLCGNLDSKNKFKKCIISNAINYLWNRRNKKSNKCCKRPRDEQIIHEQSPDRKIREVEANCIEDESGQSETEYTDSHILCDSSNNSDFSVYCVRKLRSHDSTPVPSFFKISSCRYSEKVNWMVEAQDLDTGDITTYTCKYLVLANGCSDVPNKLNLSTGIEPDWLLYDLRTLVWCLDEKISEDPLHRMDPVLVVGAGLSAADAVIEVRGRNIPVLHAFRNKSGDLNRLLPEKMYPEYHKVHQMMRNQSSNYPLYTSYPEYTLTRLNEKKHTVVLSPKDGPPVELKVSYVIVLIGSRPDLTFLPSDADIAVKHNLPIDGKTNAVNIDKMTHKVKGYDNLYAVGTLAGDNFVRFISGGALAVVAELYKINEVNET
ncbi:hypothetical protein HHI36_002014 [Cryptolaemus montrouzieri]|uniref:Oxidative stress-induced growth inhibitor 2 n=1 Tax=Cryptolaemus montrouzieri TaxID=559131 RepID=A0ABD2P9Z9_9CUCU